MIRDQAGARLEHRGERGLADLVLGQRAVDRGVRLHEQALAVQPDRPQRVLERGAPLRDPQPQRPGQRLGLPARAGQPRLGLGHAVALRARPEQGQREAHADRPHRGQVGRPGHHADREGGIGQGGGPRERDRALALGHAEPGRRELGAAREGLGLERGLRAQRGHRDIREALRRLDRRVERLAAQLVEHLGLGLELGLERPPPLAEAVALEGRAQDVGLRALAGLVAQPRDRRGAVPQRLEPLEEHQAIARELQREVAAPHRGLGVEPRARHPLRGLRDVELRDRAAQPPLAWPRQRLRRHDRVEAGLHVTDLPAREAVVLDAEGEPRIGHRPDLRHPLAGGALVGAGGGDLGARGQALRDQRGQHWIGGEGGRERGLAVRGGGQHEAAEHGGDAEGGTQAGGHEWALLDRQAGGHRRRSRAPARGQRHARVRATRRSGSAGLTRGTTRRG